ncbi:MAG: HDOD domain-containing protein [Bryobacteraceae bacterium]|nr:HDOD domain-containing protein [Bryobacteraceae bacterium]
MQCTPDLLARPKGPWALRLVPPFPAVAHRVLSLVNKDDGRIDELADLIQMDPSFSAELLRFANSSLFATPREVKSLRQAIMMVGFDRVRTIATMVALNRMVRSSLRRDSLRRVWLHSLATAVVAGEAARAYGVAVDEAYTVGLLHNLGVLGLMSAYPEEYARLMDVENEFGFELLRTERDLFEIDHCAAGAYLAQDWDLPDELAAALAVHHDEPVPGERSLDNLIKVSWRIADALGQSAFTLPPAWTLPELQAVAPLPASSWLSQGAEAAGEELGRRLAAAPA